MVDAKEYQNLLELPKKPKKALDNIQIKRMCGFYHKPRHLKERYHWNPKNFDNKLKDKKEVSVNKVSLQVGKSMNGNHEKQGNQN
jgi:hypothetical protein